MTKSLLAYLLRLVKSRKFKIWLSVLVALLFVSAWVLLFNGAALTAYLNERSANFDLEKAKKLVSLIESGGFKPVERGGYGQVDVPNNLRCSERSSAYVTVLSPSCTAFLFPTFDGFRGQGNSGRGYIYLTGKLPNNDNAKIDSNGVTFVLVNTPYTKRFKTKAYRPLSRKVGDRWYYSRYDGPRGINWVP